MVALYACAVVALFVFVYVAVVVGGALELNATPQGKTSFSGKVTYLMGINTINPDRRLKTKENYQITLAECYSMTPLNQRTIQVAKLFLQICVSKGYTISKLDSIDPFLADQIRDAHNRVYKTII